MKDAAKQDAAKKDAIFEHLDSVTSGRNCTFDDCVRMIYVAFPISRRDAQFKVKEWLKSKDLEAKPKKSGE
jgi:hypothetical protein